jgi:hypothetical protein
MPQETSSTGQPHDPSVAPTVRASHADRDRTVDTLRIAGGDGRLTLDELDERVEAALTARTTGELAELTADLPPAAETSGSAAAQVKDVIRIEQEGGSFRRDGRWTVPRRIELRSSWGDVTLDFTEAVITQDTLHVDMDMRGGTLRLITTAEIVVNPDSLSVTYGKFKGPRAADPEVPTALHVELVGHITYGRIAVQTPRRPIRKWLHRKPA